MSPLFEAAGIFARVVASAKADVGPRLLTESIEEHSLYWVLASAFVGGLIGALAKFVFETVLAHRYADARNARAVLLKLRHPLLRAADVLDKRLENFVRHAAGKGWYEKDSYYQLSTLYILGAFFSWCLILERLAFSRYHMSNRRAREFNKRFYATFKSLTSQTYFAHGSWNASSRGVLGVPRIILTEIGEVMAGTPPETWGDKPPDVIGYHSFIQRYKKARDFRATFEPLDELFKNVGRMKADDKFCRIKIFATALRFLIGYLDPGQREVSVRSVYSFVELPRDVSLVLWKDFVKGIQTRRMVSKKRELPWTYEAKISQRYRRAKHALRRWLSRLRKGYRKQCAQQPANALDSEGATKGSP